MAPAESGTLAADTAPAGATEVVTVDDEPFAQPLPPQEPPDWIKRIEGRSKANDLGLIDVTVQSLQPLYQLPDGDDTLFTQFRVNRNAQVDDPAAVSNVGVGYRRLLDDELLAGVNGFYDRDWKDAHHRVGADAELKWRALDFNFNYYVGLDTAVDGEGPQTLDGYNMEVATQLPYLPWARAQFSTSEFFTGEGADNWTNYATGIQLGLSHNVNLSAGVRGNGAIDEVGFVGVSFRFDGNPPNDPGRSYLLSDRPIAPVVFEPRDMKGHTLDKVRRIDAVLRSY